jgi:Uma2 family endonuclease
MRSFVCYREGMSTKTALSVEEYLHTVFDGSDREYLDGELVERNMGNKSHGRVQGRFIYLLSQFEGATGIFVIPEVRHKVTPTRYRIPDVAVFASEPASEVPDHPPLAAIEVLSPDDRIGYVVPKLDEYRRWGVAHIWVADPEDRKLLVYGDDGLHEVEQLELRELGIVLTKSEIFS